jgi:gliding motility-associated-like protein
MPKKRIFDNPNNNRFPLEKKHTYEGLLGRLRLLAVLITLTCSLPYLKAQSPAKFSYTGSVQTFTVPPCVKTIHVKAWGAGGSGGGTDSYNGAAGGGGGFISTDLTVVPGQVLTIVVGGGGGAGQGCVTGAGGGNPGWGNGVIDGGGGGNSGGSGCSGGGGGGGGAAGVYNGAAPLVVAGGAGGGSGGGQFSSGAPGGGGGQNGNSVPGSCTSPGISGASASGSGTIGGNVGGGDGAGAGGGGGGYNGGTGGGAATGCDCGACSGGGGVSWSSGINTVITNGNGQTPGNNADPDLAPGASIGGAGSSNGGNGFVVITFTVPTPVNTSITTFKNPSCYNSTDGTATVVASGGGGTYTYSWNPSSQTTATATGLPAGNYVVTVTDQNGCGSNANQTLSQPPQILTTSSGISPTCFGKCNGAVNTVASGGVSPYTYAWSGGCITSACNNLCAGKVSLVVTDAKGCTHADSVTLTPPAALSIAMSSQTAHCNKKDGSASAVVTGGTGASTYTWSPNPPGSSSSTYNGIAGGMYTVLVHDSKGCADSSTILVGNTPGVVASIVSTKNPSCYQGADGTVMASASSGTKPYSYNWSPSPPSGQGSANISSLGAGTYVLTVIDSSGCISTATASLKQPSQVTVVPMANSKICIGQCVPLTATGSGGTPGYTYTWTLNAAPFTPPACPVVTTAYTVIATDTNKCTSNTQTVTVTVNPPLEVACAAPASYCPGDSTSIKAIGTGGNGNYTYSWFPANGLSSTSIANPVASPTVTTTYTAIVTDNCGTPSDSILIAVAVFPKPSVSLTVSDTAGCPKLAVTFTQTSAPACSTAVWNFGDNSTNGSGCGAALHTYTKTGTYGVSIHAVDVNGCKSSFTKTNWITVYPTPVAQFTASPQPASIINPVITFTNLSSPDTCSWLWSFGDSAHSTSLRKDSIFIYPDTGCYPVKLIAMNTYGCKDSSTVLVCIQPEFTFYAPDAFTPNADGLNDEWMPRGQGIDLKNYSLYIYDRWGNEVFHTTTLGQGWDGKVNKGASGAQIDTFVWRVDLKDYKGQTHIFKGICSIIR